MRAKITRRHDPPITVAIKHKRFIQNSSSKWLVAHFIRPCRDVPRIAQVSHVKFLPRLHPIP